MKNLILAIIMLSLVASANAKVSKHALAKVAVAPVAVAKKSPKALKVTLGSALFAVEAGVDVVHLATEGLDKGGSVELKHNPFHAVNVVVGKVDSGLEKAETYFFGVQNP